MSNAQQWWGFGVTLLIGWLLYLLSPILVPFLISAFLAYLGDPLVDRLEKRLSRTLSVVIVFTFISLLLLLMLFVLLPQLERQISELIRRLPQWINWFQDNMLSRLDVWLGLELGNLDLSTAAITEHLKDIGNIVGHVLVKLTASGQILITWLAYLILIPVVTFYLLKDWDILIAKIHDLVPRAHEKLVSNLAKRCDTVLAEFLRGQVLVMMALATIYSIGLWIIGLEFALLIGVFSGLVSFVPYLGFITGVIVAGAVGLVQFYELSYLIYVLVVFGIGQAIEGLLLSPLLVGERIGLHPVAVIFAVMAGGQLFGFLGVLLALPAAAVAVVLLRYGHEKYLTSNLYT